ELARRRRLGFCDRRSGLDGLTSQFGRVRDGFVRNGLPFAPDHCDRVPHRYLALGDGDPEEDAARLRLDLLRRFVGVDLVERLALLDALPLGLQPPDDRAALHPLAEPGQLDVGGHQARARVLFTAARTSAGCGTTNCSIAGANASGANFAPTRSIGASSPSNACSCSTAATSAPNPIRVTASWATTARFVFLTDSTSVSTSSGWSVRGSTISTEMPSLSASSAALSARCTSGPVAMTVTS